MTYYIKAEQINDYLIEIGQEKFEQGYFVTLAKRATECRYQGISRTCYDSLQKAFKRYNNLKKKISKGAI